MTVQQYCLRWNNHQPNFISVFSSLLNSQSLVDVTLAAEGKQLQAHKVVLSACSSYFQSLFATNPCKHPIVILKDVKFTDLKVMVDFMYHGEVSVSQEQLPCILKTAEMLKIKGLTEIPMENPAVKCQSQPEKAEISAQSTDHWSLEENRPMSPSSPSSKRRRLKKNVICNPTITTETAEGAPNEILLSTVDNVFETVLKTEESRNLEDNSQKYNGIPIPSIQPSTSHQRETEQQQQQPTHQIITQITPPQDVNVNTSQVDCSPVEMSRTCTSSQPTTGIQWNVLDQTGFTHFSSTSAVLSNNVGTQFTHSSESHPTSHPNNNILHHPNAAVAEQYQNHKRKRSFNPQGDENFLRALEAVRYGGIGFCKAARMYGVNNRTLWLEYKKRGYPNFRLSIKNRNQQSDKAKEQSAVNSDRNACTINHPIAIISSDVFDGKHVDYKQVPGHRSKYFDGNENAAETINFQSINIEQM